MVTDLIRERSYNKITPKRSSQPSLQSGPKLRQREDSSLSPMSVTNGSRLTLKSGEFVCRKQTYGYQRGKGEE